MMIPTARNADPMSDDIAAAAKFMSVSRCFVVAWSRQWVHQRITAEKGK
jgi:hypothetical protein